jgi:hypothetical protein
MIKRRAGFNLRIMFRGQEFFIYFSRQSSVISRQKMQFNNSRLPKSGFGRATIQQLNIFHPRKNSIKNKGIYAGKISCYFKKNLLFPGLLIP